LEVILIAGPTASGKTAKAIELATVSGAQIVNTDSMQVYGNLSVLTARPSPDELGRAEHVLFGHVDGEQIYSVAHWLDDVAMLVNRARREKRPLVFAGGTGLYFNGLLQGLSPIPEIDPEVRNKWRNSSSHMDSESMHNLLKEKDELAAKSIIPMDSQRIVRALEVVESTGRSIVSWREEQGAPLLNERDVKERHILEPTRESLHTRINARVLQMVERGAIEEVQCLLARKFDDTLPIMKAIGVPQLMAYLAGQSTLDDAIAKIQAATRQYAKRQSTWFRNSFGSNWCHIPC